MKPQACRNASPSPAASDSGLGHRDLASIEALGARASSAGVVLDKPMLGRCSVALLFIFLGACGRPATQQECDEIVVRVTELELKSRGVAGGDGQEVQDTKEALRKSTLHDCVGRRISDKAMACVRSATTAQQLVNECF
jgi:hypothetical protein